MIDKPKKFLFVSVGALIGDIAWMVRKEGHEVRYFIETESERSIADGFVDKVDDWESHVDWADVIVFDDVLGQGEKAKKLRDAGKHVIGGTPYTDRLEDDRSFGQEELKRHGVSIIPFQDFSDFDSAIDYVSKHPAPYVIKPSGEAQNIKRLLFVGQEDDGRDVIHVLQSYKAAYADTVKVFQLQRRVRGVEVAVGAFFNGTDFMMPINVNFEHKPLFPGNIGPATGEMGTCMYWSGPNRIFRRNACQASRSTGRGTLRRLYRRQLHRQWPGHLSAGVHCALRLSDHQHPGGRLANAAGDFLHGMAAGTLTNFKTKRGFQIGIRIVVPPFPYNDPKTFEANSKDRVIIFRKPNYDGIHIEDVKLVNGEWLITGTSGVILIVTGFGVSVKQAQAQAYQRVKNILIPNMYYRTDIGDRWLEDHDKLHSWGYLRES